jgi:hypothetical protein
VEINLAGCQRGASETPVRTGWVLYSPLTTQIIEFPTYVQTVKWTKDVNEGHQVNEEMGFNSKEGMEILVDVRCPMPSSPPRLRIFMSSTAWVSWTSSRTEFYAISCAILSTR